MNRLLLGVASLGLAVGLLFDDAMGSRANAADAYTVLEQDKRFRTWTKMIGVADLAGC